MNREERLAAFESMLKNVMDRYADTTEKMENLKAEERLKVLHIISLWRRSLHCRKCYPCMRFTV